jgi:hypothetical protein
MSRIIQFDADPQQTLMGDLKIGLQIVATINMEDLIDTIGTHGQEHMATKLGNELINLLKVEGSLTAAINPQKHIELIREEMENRDDK